MGPFENSQRDNRKLAEDAAPKDACCGQSSAAPTPQAPQGTGSSMYHMDPRRIIEEKIEHHNRCADRLHRLLRALPQEMHRDAEMALVSILWHEPI